MWFARCFDFGLLMLISFVGLGCWFVVLGYLLIFWVADFVWLFGCWVGLPLAVWFDCMCGYTCLIVVFDCFRLLYVYY